MEWVWNADGFSVFYMMAPTQTIGGGQIYGSKKQKQRMKCLPRANADVAEKFPMLVIGNAHKPRCFKNKTGAENRFNYHFNKKAWMNSSIF